MQSKYRLKRRKDFQKIYRHGKSLANRELVMYVIQNYETDFRLGISVSKKIGKAVVRNRIKRLIKEVFRYLANNYNLKKNIDIIIIARAPTVNMEYQDYLKSILHLLKKSKLVR